MAKTSCHRFDRNIEITRPCVGSSGNAYRRYNELVATTVQNNILLSLTSFLMTWHMFDPNAA